MVEVEHQQTSSSADESISAVNARLQNKVLQLTREKKELVKKVAHYEEYTQHLCSVLRKLKGMVDGLAGQSALISEALSYRPETEEDEQDEENVPEQPQPETNKKMQTASVLPMVRGFPIRRIIIPLQRLNINTHRHRPNRIHGHRRESWWRETEQPPQEPRQEVRRPNLRVPVRRLQRAERRQHRVGRPRTRPAVRNNTHRRQETAVVERNNAQNHRGGSSHQMLQAVVLLQRLSLTQHQQQQHRVLQQSRPVPSDNLRTPVVMLRDISTTMQAGDKTFQKAVNPVTNRAIVEPQQGTSASPSVEPETERPHMEVDDAGPSVELEPEGSCVEAESSDSPTVKQVVERAEGRSCQEPCSFHPPSECVEDAARSALSQHGSNEEYALDSDPPQSGLHKGDAMDSAQCQPDAAESAKSQPASCGEDAVEPQPRPCREGATDSSLSQSGSHIETESSALSAESLQTDPETTVLFTEAMSSETENEPNSTLQATISGPSTSRDISLLQPDSSFFQNNPMETSEQLKVVPKEPQGTSSLASSVASESTENEEIVYSSKTAELQTKVEPCGSTSTLSTSRKRKASPSAESAEKCSVSNENDVIGEMSIHSPDEQSCRPRRRCAIRKNYALLFAGWNV